jgi:hypothetical protein
LPDFENLGSLDMFSFASGDPDTLRDGRLRGWPWWTPNDFKVSFWRPVTALTHGLDYVLWPNVA